MTGVLLVACPLLICACEDREALTEEARRFLEAYKRVPHKAPPAAQRQALEALEALPLRRRPVVEARALCVAAHRALMGAEEVSEAAARALDEVLQRTEGAAPLAPADIARIKADVERSERRRLEAMRKFARCEDRCRELELRYGR